MQEVIISEELQQSMSAVFGGYRRRRHDRAPNPEVASEVFYRRPSRRPSRRLVRRAMHQGKAYNRSMSTDTVENYVTFDFEELRNLGDIKEESETSDRSSTSSSCSSDSIISLFTGGPLNSKVIYQH